MPSLILLHNKYCQIVSVPSLYRFKKNYSMLGLVMDNNPLPEEVRIICRREFGHFFITIVVEVVHQKPNSIEVLLCKSDSSGYPAGRIPLLTPSRKIKHTKYIFIKMQDFRDEAYERIARFFRICPKIN